MEKKKSNNKKGSMVLLILIGILLIVLIFVVVNKQKNYEQKYQYFGEEINFSFRANNGMQPDKVIKDIDGIVKKLAYLFDKEKNDDDEKHNLYYINNELELNKSLELDEDLFNLFLYGIEDCYSKSDGYIDVTGSNIENVEMDEDSKMIKISKRITFNFDLIMDGYVLDEITKYLDNSQIRNYVLTYKNLTKVGGATVGDKAHKIKVNYPDQDKLLTTLNLNYLAVATTSKEDNKNQIDLKTNEKANYTHSVTVVALMPSTAEFLANLLYMMPVETGITYIDDIAGVEAIWYDLDGKVHYSANINKYNN